jgi:tetratricopeptide (TPR) repeat protein
MPTAAKYDLLLLGYRNDLARERTVTFLRRLSTELGGPVDIQRDTPLPFCVLAGVGRDQGLLLLTALSERGAQARLAVEVAADAPELAEVASVAKPEPRAARGGMQVWLVLGLVALAASGLALWQRRGERLPALPPALQRAELMIAGREPLRGNALNDEAVRLNEAGDFAGAAQRLRAALRDNPDQEVLRANLSTVLRNWAVAEINGGRPEGAIELLGEILQDSKSPEVVALLGIAQERLGSWHEAGETLERALRLGSKDPLAFVALGNVYRHQGDRQGAVEMLQRARESGASGEEFETLLARLERELDAEWDFVGFSTPHFQISFAQGKNREAAHAVAQVLEDAYFSVGRKLDLYPDEITEVVLYASEDFHDVTQTPDWTGGVYDGRIKLPVRGLAGESDLLVRTLRHEYGHVLVTRHSRGRVPVWLNEGIAIWVEEQEDGERVEWAFDQIAGQRLFRLSELEPPFTRLPADRVQVAYAQSYLAVRYIIDEFGERRLGELLRSAANGRELDQSFEEVLALGLADFESKLLRTLTS